MPTLPFLQSFFMGFCSDAPWNVPAKFEVRSFTRSWDNIADWAVPGYAFQGHPRSLILVPIESVYTTSCQSVIVTLVISCTVSEILRVFCAPGRPHPYSTLILGVFPLHQIAHVGVNPSGSLKLFGRETVFDVFQPVWKSYLNVTDRRTDDLLRHNHALRSIAR